MLKNKNKYYLSFFIFFVGISCTEAKNSDLSEEVTFEFRSLAGEVLSQEIGSDVSLEFMGLKRLIQKDELKNLSEKEDYYVFGKGSSIPPVYRYKSPMIHVMKTESEQDGVVLFHVRLKFEFQEMISECFVRDCQNIFEIISPSGDLRINRDKYVDIMECLTWFVENELQINKSKEYLLLEKNYQLLAYITYITSINLYKDQLRKSAEMEITLNKLKIFEKELLSDFDQDTPQYSDYLLLQNNLKRRIPSHFRYGNLKKCSIEELKSNIRIIERQLKSNS